MISGVLAETRRRRRRTDLGPEAAGFAAIEIPTRISVGLEITMTAYTVGLKLSTRTKALTIEAEDALLAALRIKLDNPEALITYVRKSNRRGDRRHPHEALRK